MSRHDDPVMELVGDLARVRNEQLRGVVTEDTKRQLAVDIIERDDDAGESPVPAPRRGQRARRVLAMATAVVAMLAAVVFGWPIGTPPVVADWTDTPQDLDETELANFDDWCRNSGVIDGDQLVLADKRGRMIVGTYLSQAGQIAHCVRYEQADVDAEEAPLYAGSQRQLEQPLEAEHDRPVTAARLGGGFGYPPERVASAQVHGQVAAEVEEVIGVLDDGRTFQATISDGYFHGWWPQTCPSLWRPGAEALKWLRSSDPHEACSPWLDRLDAYDVDGDRIDRWEVETRDVDLEGGSGTVKELTPTDSLSAPDSLDPSGQP